MSKGKKIIIASPLGSQKITSAIQEALLAKGHEVVALQKHAEALKRHLKGSVGLTDKDKQLFSHITLVLASSDMLVILLPSQNSVCLAGMAHVSGVPVVAVSGKPRHGSLLLKCCVDFWCESGEDLTKLVDHWPFDDDEA